MTSNRKVGGKLPGKTLYAGRRRAATRTSGFSVHNDTTGGEFRRHSATTYTLSKDEVIEIRFHLKGYELGELLGFGLWFWHTNTIESQISGVPGRLTLTSFGEDSWNKAGSIWVAESSEPIDVVFILKATSSGEAAIYNPTCGRIAHKHYNNAPIKLMANMFEMAPEAIFIEDVVDEDIEMSLPKNTSPDDHELILKSCNRCGRYLPINITKERNHLSFTNHCVAEHRRPCKHPSFGRLRNIDDLSDIIQLDYGYQLECRFCKKFEVNAAHNPQRSSSQMKEDGARRRAFELLLEELYQGSPQLRYRHKFKSELAEDVWHKFGKQCFNCPTELESVSKMHLDHTRPLAYLWPLDETATALCKSCNSQKRDRMPSEFYSKPQQLERLAEITRIPLNDLKVPKPNEEAIDLLLSRRDWFFDVFLARPEMAKERDGKITGELVVKALQRAISSSGKYRSVNLLAEYESRRT